jgi:probable HAF family extracellular repeat protein
MGQGRGTMPRTTGRAGVVSISEGGALAARIGCRQQSLTLLIAVLLACVATLALTALPSATAPRSSAVALRQSFRHQLAIPLPISLAPSASASIGAAERGFWPVRHRGALLTQGGGIHSTFTASGAALRMGHGTLGLSFIGVGRGGHLAPIGAVAPTGAANQIVYRHWSVSESYRNGPYGLEQGYTVRQRPQTGTGSLVLALSVGGSLTPEQAGSQVLFRTHAGATALRYGQLSAIDAAGRRLPALMQVRNGSLELRIDDSHARYPVRIDPFIQQGEKLTGGGEIGGGGFGGAVALSADGSTALIGAPGDNEDVGAVWVFTRSGSTWTQQAKLTGSGESGVGRFGQSVALSSDGNTALIGGSSDNSAVGAAWVFTRSGSTWTQQGTKRTGSGESGRGEFGSSVALSSEGNTALIGGEGDNASVGAAWVFTRSGSTWTQQGEKLTGGGELGEGYFGVSVALSSEGNTALIGGLVYNQVVGSAWVFTRSGSSWTQQAKLTAGGEIGEGFGGKVALSGDGNTALIGGSSDNPSVGAAWVFTRSGSTWTQQGEKLTGGGEIGKAGFGASVALSGDGNTALIGGPNDNSAVGAVWVFTRSGSTWTQQGEKLTGSGGESSGYRRFGERVALSADGNTALIGGPYDNTVVTEFEAGGAAWVFTNTSARAPTVVTGAVSFVTQVSATLGATVNPNGAGLSDCHFEYGTTTSYGSSVPCTPPLLGSETSPVAVSGSLTGLRKGTTYHFRIVATNLGGTSSGADEMFSTATQRSQVTDLGTLGGPTSEAAAINKFGQVTGGADLATISVGRFHQHVVHAFRWSKGVMTDLGGEHFLEESPPGSCTCSSGKAINDAGDVAGWALTFSGDGVATEWQGTTISNLGPGGIAPHALGINNAGDVVGETFGVCTGVGESWLNRNGAITYIGFGAYNEGRADGVNNRGQVVGTACLEVEGRPNHAYVWKSGTITDLGTLGGTNSEATAISDTGQIVGFSLVSGDAAEHAFRRVGGSLEDLGTLGGTNSRALAVNGAGRVVGYSDVATGGTHAFLYSAGSIEDLNNYIPASSGWVLERATGINNSGQIVGTGIHNGVKRGFLLARPGQ